MTLCDLTRRAFCASAPAESLAPVLPSAAPAPADPILDLIAEWHAAHRDFESAGAAPEGSDLDSLDCERAWQRMQHAEFQLSVHPAVTPEGLAAHITWALDASQDGEFLGDRTLAALRTCAWAASRMGAPSREFDVSALIGHGST